MIPIHTSSSPPHIIHNIKIQYNIIFPPTSHRNQTPLPSPLYIFTALPLIGTLQKPFWQITKSLQLVRPKTFPSPTNNG